MQRQKEISSRHSNTLSTYRGDSGMQGFMQTKSLRLRSLSMGLALFAAQSAFALAAHAQTSYQLTPLGSLGGGLTEANAINSVGDVAGCSLAVINGAATLRAFAYRNGEMMDIGSLANGGTSCAYDINDAGEITGNSATPSGESRAFIYRDGTMTSLGNLGSSSIGNSINNASLIAGSANDQNGSYIGAFRYDALLTPPQVDIGTVGGIITQSRSINAAGDIAGWAVNADSRGTSFLYQNGVITDLGTVLGFPSQAMAINDLGQVVGSRTPGGGYLYLNGTVTDLPSLAGNGSSPSSINNVEQIVGSSWTETGNHAFVITQGQIVDLNDAIVAGSPDKPFVTLEDATGINDNGWIVADGIDSRTGVRGAYLLRPVP
jgi:probable HAF family extracellular repeat protein